MLNPDTIKVCHVQPMGVTKNASFNVGVDDVEFADLKADNLGTWKTNGTKTTHFWIRPVTCVKRSMQKILTLCIVLCWSAS